jgi:hypothetical protein
MPGHVYSVGEPLVVPVNRRRPAYYDADVCYEYDLQFIYFGAGDGGWMNSTIKYEER